MTSLSWKRSLFCGLFVILAVVAVSAQVNDSAAMRANIPFQFSVGKVTLPAGSYSTESINSAAIALRDAEGKACAITLTQSTIDLKATSKPARMVFERYGDEYFLSEIWNGSSDTGLKVPKPHRALELGKLNAPHDQIAVLLYH